MQSWHISVQRELIRNMLIDVAYIGNRGDDLLLFANYNQANPNNAAGTIPLQDRRPNPAFSDITYAFNGGKSRYKALQAKWEWRVSRDVTLLNSLTCRRRRTTARSRWRTRTATSPRRRTSGTWRRTSACPIITSPTTTPRASSGRCPSAKASAGCRRHRRSSTRWSAAGSSRASTGCTAGEPVTFTYTPGATFVVSGIAQDFRGANNYRPNVTCDPMASGDERTINNWFNRACVAVPTDPSQPFGNAERNSVSGPKYWSLDLVASKRVPLGGPAQFELRIEAFNVLNKTNYRAPNGNRSAAGFGTITSTFDPRQLQLAAKVLW